MLNLDSVTSPAPGTLIVYELGGVISYTLPIKVASAVMSNAVLEFKSSSVEESVILAEIVYDVFDGTVIS